MGLWKSERYDTQGLFSPLWKSDKELGWLNLPLQTSLVPNNLNIQTVPTFVRSTTATVIDFEGVVQTAKINELRFSGARRVENLLSNTEALSTQTITVISGASYMLSFAGTGSVTLSGAATGTLSGTGSSRVEITKSTTTTSLTLTVSGSVLQAQLEKVSGTQTTASEYVNIGVLSYPYHGAGIDGVKYFNTDRSGAKIPDATLKGYLNEPESTNLVTYSEEFDRFVTTGPQLFTYSGTGSEAIITQNYGIAPNGTKTADRIQLSLNGGVTDSDRSGANVAITTLDITKKYSASLYVKVLTPDIDLDVLINNVIGRLAAGGITLSKSYKNMGDDWLKFNSVAAPSLTSGTYRIQIYGSLGIDSVDMLVWGAQLEESPFPTSYIKTEASTVTRTADSLTVDNSSRKVLPNSFCLAGTWTPLGDGGDYKDSNVRLFGSQDSMGGNNEVRTYGNATEYDYAVTDGKDQLDIYKSDISQSIQAKYAIQLRQDGSNVNVKIYKDGVDKLCKTKTQTLDHSNTSLEIGSWAGAVFASNIKDIKIYNKELSDSQLARITS